MLYYYCMKKYTTFKEMRAKLMKDPEFKKGYDDLELEFSLISAIIDRRIKDGLTQKQLAEKIGTKQSAIARFESGTYNPSLLFIKKLAQALGLKLTVRA